MLDITCIIFKILHVLFIEDTTLFYRVIWSIWKQMDNKVWNDMVDARSHVLERAKSEFRYAPFTPFKSWM